MKLWCVCVCARRTTCTSEQTTAISCFCVPIIVCKTFRLIGNLLFHVFETQSKCIYFQPKSFVGKLSPSLSLFLPLWACVNVKLNESNGCYYRLFVDWNEIVSNSRWSPLLSRSLSLFFACSSFPLCLFILLLVAIDDLVITQTHESFFFRVCFVIVWIL